MSNTITNQQLLDAIQGLGKRLDRIESRMEAIESRMSSVTLHLTNLVTQKQFDCFYIEFTDFKEITLKNQDIMMSKIEKLEEDSVIRIEWESKIEEDVKRLNTAIL